MGLTQRVLILTNNPECQAIRNMKDFIAQTNVNTLELLNLWAGNRGWEGDILHGAFKFLDVAAFVEFAKAQEFDGMTVCQLLIHNETWETDTAKALSENGSHCFDMYVLAKGEHI